MNVAAFRLQINANWEEQKNKQLWSVPLFKENKQATSIWTRKTQQPSHWEAREQHKSYRLNAGLLGVAPETHFDKGNRKLKTNIHLHTLNQVCSHIHPTKTAESISCKSCACGPRTAWSKKFVWPQRWPWWWIRGSFKKKPNLNPTSSIKFNVTSVGEV